VALSLLRVMSLVQLFCVVVVVVVVVIVIIIIIIIIIIIHLSKLLRGIVFPVEL
jgi:hypothetical protein